MSSEANKSQIDGTHYKTAYEHWDYALDAGLGVLEYAATKHLGRYDKKGEPLNDLRKARHYVQKLIENTTLASLLCPRNRFDRAYLQGVVARFIDANNIPGDAADAVVELTCWQTREDLFRVLGFIDRMIGCRERAQNRIEAFQRAKTAPLEDSNKHADRSDNE
jgi:hypothetical protein